MRTVKWADITTAGLLILEGWTILSYGTGPQAVLLGRM